MNKIKSGEEKIEKLKYDWDTQSLIFEIVDKINQIIGKLNSKEGKG